jgi:hypothetical protein
LITPRWKALRIVLATLANEHAVRGQEIRHVPLFEAKKSIALLSRHLELVEVRQELGAAHP